MNSAGNRLFTYDIPVYYGTNLDRGGQAACVPTSSFRYRTGAYAS